MTRELTFCAYCSGLGSGSSFDKSGSVGTGRVTGAPDGLRLGRCGLLVGDFIKRQYGIYGGILEGFQGQGGADSNGSKVNIFVSS